MLKALSLIVTALALSAVTRAASLVDLSFDPGSGAGGGIVEQALPMPDGRILICGNFTSFDGVARAYVARLNADGSVDESFEAHPGYWVRHLSLQADGRIVIGGYFTTVAGVPRSLVARLNADGTLDTTFNPGTGATAIIAGGVDGNNTPFVFWTAVQPDGKILITGNFRYYNGASSTGLARLNPDGSLDTTFNVGNGLDSWGRHILVQPNGQILVSGWFTAYRGQWFNRLVRIDPDGTPDSSFTPFFGDKTAIYSTALVDGGRMIAAGHSLNPDGLFKREMARLNPNGSVDESFTGFTNEKTETTAVQSDGKVIVGGNFSMANNVQRRCLARFFPDGTLDPTFSANVDNFIWSCVLQPDGKLLIAGGFYSVDGIPRVGVARLETGVSGGGGPQDVPPALSVSGTTANSLMLSWSDNSGVRTGYDLEQKSGAAYVKIVSVGSGSRSYTVGGLAPATPYTFRLRAYNSLGSSLVSNDAAGTTSAAPGGGGGGSGAAAFVSADRATGGSWPGTYGGSGYVIVGDRSSTPSFVTVTPAGQSDWTWQWSTMDTRAVQRPARSDRLAACWYASGSYTIDLRFNDGQAHRTAIYFLDWDRMNRAQSVTVTDAGTGALLDARTVSGFADGVYLVWDFSGNVRLTITAQSGNAVAGAILFGPAGAGGGTTPTAATPTISPNGGTYPGPQQVTLATTTGGAEIRYTLDGSEPSASSPLYAGAFTLGASATVKAKAFASGHHASATASASFTIGTGGGGNGNFRFVGIDTATRGNWIGVYGAEGYHVFGKGQSYPSYVQVTPSGNQQWTWNDTTTDTRGLQTPDGSSRTAGCWYLNGTFEIGFNFTGAETHRLAIYLCDWDASGRSQTVELADAATGAVLDTRTLSAFSGGQYLVWDLKGGVKLRFTRRAGFNAVVNGLFFGPSPTPL